MADVKEWDLFPTKIFESKFVANDEILNFINKEILKILIIIKIYNQKIIIYKIWMYSVLS